MVGFEGRGGGVNIHKRRQVRKEWWGLRGGGGGYQHSQEEAGKEGVGGFEGRGGYQHSQEEAGRWGLRWRMNFSETIKIRPKESRKPHSCYGHSSSGHGAMDTVNTL